MDTEFQQLTKEIDRVATTTKFNNTDILAKMSTNGSVRAVAQSANFQQIGWEVGGRTGSRNKLAISRFNFTTGLSGTMTSGNIFGKFMRISAGGGMTSVISAYGKTTISSQAKASIAVMKIDSALSNIGTVRAKWGAFQNRLQNTVGNLQNLHENITAAASRINDTNYAQESANLARTQVLQQAGMSMLTQSNQSSQNIMSLLR
jgi:flagellin